MLKESKQIPVFPDIKPLTKHAVSPFPYRASETTVKYTDE